MGTGSQDSSSFCSFCRKPKPKPVCQTAHALRTAQLSTHEGSSEPHIPGFPCFSLSLRSGCSPLPLYLSAKGRVKGNYWGQYWMTAREDLAQAWPPPALSRDSFASFAVPEGFLGFEMSTISAILSKYKVCNHRMFPKVPREINYAYTYAHPLHAYIPFTHYHVSHRSTHT